MPSGDTTLLKCISIAFLVLFLYAVYKLCIEDMYYTANIKVEDIHSDMATINRVINSSNDQPISLYYINLAKSVDRNKTFLSRLDKTICPIRIDAVSPETIPETKQPLKCRFMMKTEYACLASHLKAIHTAYHNGEPFAIICEDDAVIQKNINWRTLMDSAPSDWEILQLHTCCITKNNYNSNGILKYFNNNSNLWIKPNSIVPSAAFYIVSRSCMQKLLTQYVNGYEQPEWSNINHLDLTPSRVNCQADLLLFDNAVRYICTYPLIDITQSKSTISWTHDWNDYSHYKKS